MNLEISGGSTAFRGAVSYIFAASCATLAACCLVWVTLGFKAAALALVCIAAVGFLVWCIGEPIRLLYLVPFLLCTEYRMRLGPVSFSVGELGILLVWILAFRRIWRDHRVSYSTMRTDLIVVIIVGLFSLPSLIFEQNTTHAFSAWRDLVAPFLFYIGFRLADMKYRQMLRLIAIYIAVAVCSATLGIVQFYTGRFAWFQGDEDWVQYKLSYIAKSIAGQWLGAKGSLALGLYSGVNDFGFYLVMTIIVAFGICIGEPSRRQKYLLSIGILVMMAALIGTFFRSGLISVLCAALFLLYFRSRILSFSKLGMIALPIALISVLILQSRLFAFDELGTASGRFDMAQDAFDLIVRHPWTLLTGGMADYYRAFYNEPQDVHVWVLYSVLRFGLIVTLALLSYYVARLTGFVRFANSADGADRFLGIAIFVAVGAMILVLGLTEPLLDNIQNSMVVLFWVGIGGHLCSYQHSMLRAEPEKYSGDCLQS